MGPGLLSVRPMATVRAPAASNHLIGSAHRRQSVVFLQSQQPMSFTTLSLLSGVFVWRLGFQASAFWVNCQKKSPERPFCFVHREDCLRSLWKNFEKSLRVFGFSKTFVAVESLSSHTCRPDEEEEEETSGRIPSPSV